ncbi:MAG: hypothetical protein KAJ05_11520, partial [Candidatus Latescibacteria bacterium]|nr:hypothetical protein [Candidatus Latescibacterota bacterium]
KDDHLRFQVDCKYASGMIVKMALPNHSVAEMLCDTNPISYKMKHELDRDWASIMLPMREHAIQVIVEAE